MNSLTIFYDPNCGLCSSFREWLEVQALWLPVEFVGYQSPLAEKVFPRIGALKAGSECVVLADDGKWWQGADAWIVCLWATREFRMWSHRLAGPMLKPMLGSVVNLISNNRLTLSRLMRLTADADLARELGQHQADCGNGSCVMLPHLKEAKDPYNAWK